MTKEEYGELLKSLGILKFVIHEIQHQEREQDLEKNILHSIDIILNSVPIIEEYIKN